MAGMAVNQHVGGANGQPSSSNHSKNKRFSIGGWSPPNCCLTISNQLVNFLRTCFCCCCCCCGCVDRSHYKNHQPRTKHHHHHHQRRPSFNRDRRLSFPELNCSTSAAEPSLTSSPRLSNLKEQDSRNNPDTQNANNNELIGLSNSSGDECGNHLNHHHHHHPHRRRRSFKNNIVSRLLFGLLPNRKRQQQQQQQQNSRISVTVLSPAIVCCDVEQNIQTTISAQNNQQTSSSSSSSRLMQLSASSSLANNNYKNNDGDNFHCDLIPRNNLNSNNGNYDTHKTFELLESTTNTKGSPLDCQNVNKEDEEEEEEDDDDDDDDVEDDKDVGNYSQPPRPSSYLSIQSMPSCSGLQIVDPNIHHQQQQPCGSSPQSSKAAGTPKKSAKLSLSSLMSKSTFGSKSKSLIQPQQSLPHPTIQPPSTSIKASTSSFGMVNEQQHKLRMDVSSKRLMKEIGDLMRRQQNQSLNANFSVELIDDSLYEWDIKIYEFDKESQIYLDMQQYQIPYVQLHAMFPETYPFDPPFIRVVAPYIERGYVMEGGAICLELLTKTGWTSAYTMESVIIQLMASFVKGQAIIKATKDVGKCFTKKSAVNSFRHIVRIHDKHGWVDTPLYEG